MPNVSTHDRVKKSAMVSVEDIKNGLSTEEFGLSNKQVERNRDEYGNNYITKPKRSIWFTIRHAFINPFSIVLTILAVISLFTDVIFAKNFNRNYITVIITLVMLLVSGIIRLLEELKSNKITEKLVELVHSTVGVYRNGEWQDIDAEEIVVGDYVRLYSGDRVPADIRIIIVDGCSISESVITGESEIREKSSDIIVHAPSKLQDYANIAFSGTSVMSGSLEGIVVAVGKDSAYGDIKVSEHKSNSGFDKGANSIAWVLIRFMAVLIPLVFIASGLTKGNWLHAFLFALSVAVGLTPELLPMVITACLAKGSASMGKKQTVVNNINAMQGFGSMDVLCVDKTGTLTGDELLLEYYMDILGNESGEVLNYAYINSYYHSGLNNHIDNAVMRYGELTNKKNEYELMAKQYQKVDELSFDYDRKISSILVEKGGKRTLITKGDINSILAKCRYAKYKNKLINIDDESLRSIHAIVDDMQDEGMKVIAVATKEVDNEDCTETNMMLIGYIAFFDAPKKSAASAIKKLSTLNVNVKVLTGDNREVAISICRRLNMHVEHVMTGEEFDHLSDNEAQVSVENTTIFAELTPRQKASIIKLLESNGHFVGFLGDGINDLPAMMEADVGISVDTATPSVKETADVILLKKDLNVLEEGIIEGRRSFANMSKYIKITASSNLGNIIAIVIASIFLPFFPMTSVQLLLLNLLYDILCLILPWDNVDDDMLSKPLEWSGTNLSRFMLFFGPISSIFDIFTFTFLMYYICPTVCGGNFASLSQDLQYKFVALFQTGWFLESMWTQILIIYLLRSKKLSFLSSRPSTSVIVVTLVGIALFTVFAMTPLGSIIGLNPLPAIYFAFLVMDVLCYLLVVTIAKKIYIKKYKKLI